MDPGDKQKLQPAAVLVAQALTLLDVLCMLPVDVLRKMFCYTRFFRMGGGNLRATCKQARDLMDRLPTEVMLFLGTDRHNSLRTGKFLGRLAHVQEVSLRQEPAKQVFLSEENLLPALVSLKQLHTFHVLRLHTWRVSMATFALIAQGIPNLKHLKLHCLTFVDELAFYPLAACEHLVAVTIDLCYFAGPGPRQIASLAAITSLRELELDLDLRMAEDDEQTWFSFAFITVLTQLTKLEVTSSITTCCQVPSLSALSNLKELLMPHYFQSEDEVNTEEQDMLDHQLADALKGLTQLEYLFLPLLLSKSVAVLGELTQLTSLMVGDLERPLSDAAVVVNLPSLVKVGCRDSRYDMCECGAALPALTQLLSMAHPGAVLHAPAVIALGQLEPHESLQSASAALSKAIEKCDEQFLPTELNLLCCEGTELPEQLAALRVCPWVKTLRILNASSLSAEIATLICSKFPNVLQLICVTGHAASAAFLQPLLTLPLQLLSLHNITNLSAADLVYFTVTHPEPNLTVISNAPGFNTILPAQKAATRQAFGLA